MLSRIPHNRSLLPNAILPIELLIVAPRGLVIVSQNIEFAQVFEMLSPSANLCTAFIVRS